MIKGVRIENYKSISKLEIELGGFNVIIGENGCGKSNILEAMALGGAASADQLRPEFLSARGVRVSRPELMRSAFSSKEMKKDVRISFDLLPKKGSNGKKRTVNFSLQNENKAYSEWYDVDKMDVRSELPSFMKDLFFSRSIDIGSGSEENEKIVKLRDLIQGSDVEEIRHVFSGEAMKKMAEELYSNDKFAPDLSSFTIYSPENTFLRKFEDEEQIQPLGIRGEGLFKLLKVFSQEKDQTSLSSLKKYLRMMDWFEDLEIPGQTFEGEKLLNLRDRYLDSSVFIQQQNANEGFLFLLFYLCLFISKDTPNFFAIDNIEASFNPRMCSEVTRVFQKLSKEKKKQAIFTTHNPYVLDGLDLEDDEQRLFVVRRNADGHTIASRVKPNSSKRKLSEAWMLGYFGGLPKNF